MSGKHHYLKISPRYFMAVDSGLKPFEVRVNDRDFKRFDILHLQEWCGEEYSGNETVQEVTYILDDPNYCKEGYVIMALKPYVEGESK